VTAREEPGEAWWIALTLAPIGLLGWGAFVDD
jgi:hypothetical protein